MIRKQWWSWALLYIVVLLGGKDCAMRIVYLKVIETYFFFSPSTLGKRREPARYSSIHVILSTAKVN